MLKALYLDWSNVHHIHMSLRFVSDGKLNYCLNTLILKTKLKVNIKSYDGIFITSLKFNKKHLKLKVFKHKSL